MAKNGKKTAVEVPERARPLVGQKAVEIQPYGTIVKLSGVLTSDVLLQANNFARSIDLVITVIKSGLDALGKRLDDEGTLL